jgi:signal transduction histidine kinase
MSIPWRLPRLRAGRAGIVLLALLLAIYGVALAGIVNARQQARAAAVEELRRSTADQARSSEVALQTLRADLVFLASSPRLQETLLRSDSRDPVQRRWARLETESTLLLFAQGHPELAALGVLDRAGAAVTWIARPSGSAEPMVVADPPVLLPWAFRLSLPIEGGGSIESVADPGRLLEATAPGRGAVLVSGDERAPAGEGELVVREPVDARGFSAPPALLLERRRGQGELLGTFEQLARSYRTTLLLNLLVLALGLPLVALALHEARRAAAFAAARAHEEERRQLERSLWHQERLATVGRLAARIAHEINNPLAGVSNHLTLLDEDLQAGNLDAAGRRVPRLREGVERMALIVRRALRLAEPGRSERGEVDVLALAEETVSLLAGTAPAVAVRVRALGALVGSAAGGGVTVQGDRTALAQLLTNLVLNALQMQSTGGEVEVIVSRAGDEVLIEVADRGPGVDDQVMSRLFEPFVSSRGSTGLGLAVCHGIVHEHGGSIDAENRPGGGALFTVKLPVVSRHAQEAS